MTDLTLIAQGAEARVYRGTFGGRPCIMKERFPKKYRQPILDTTLTKRRLNQEARCMLRCFKSGVAAPALYHVDHLTSRLYMEFVDAPTARAVLKANPGPALEAELARQIGGAIAKLHAADVVHGDLTTSNMLWKDNKLVLIDFGLSYTSSLAEDKGVDLYVLERAFLSTHPNTEALFASILEHYSSSYKGSKAIIAKLDEVRLRGRKRTMVG